MYVATDLAIRALGWKANYGLDEITSSSWRWEQYARDLKCKCPISDYFLRKGKVSYLKAYSSLSNCCCNSSKGTPLVSGI